MKASSETNRKINLDALQAIEDTLIVHPDHDGQREEENAASPADLPAIARGRVVATGTGKTMECGSVRPMRAGPGDFVLFRSAGAESFTLEKKRLVAIKEEAILCILPS